MARDAIVDEVRAARDAYAKRFGYDLAAIVRDLKEQERKSGRKVVRLPAQRIERVPASEQRRTDL
jgi:hypothetical protein